MNPLEYSSFNPDGTFDDSAGSPIRAVSGIRDSTLGKQAKAVAWALISRASKHGEEWVAWPSLPTLCGDTGWSRARVHEGLQELRAAGLLTWERGGWEPDKERSSANSYTLDLIAMEAMKRPARKR